MILISGVHCVGKSHFCAMVKEQLGIDSYSASRLIEERKKEPFPASKLIKDIDENQLYLLDAVSALRNSQKEFMLDGHFCLFDTAGRITRIPKQTYIDLMPDKIILLTENPEIIAKRRFERDAIETDLEQLHDFQNAETEYAKEVSSELNIPLYISEGASDLQKIIDILSNKEA